MVGQFRPILLKDFYGVFRTCVIAADCARGENMGADASIIALLIAQALYEERRIDRHFVIGTCPPHS